MTGGSQLRALAQLALGAIDDRLLTPSKSLIREADAADDRRPHMCNSRRSW